MLKVVLDTNVFVSSLLVRQGPPAKVLEAWRGRQYLLAISPAIIAEIEATLRYPRIRHKYAITDDDVSGVRDLLEQHALLVPGDLDVSGAIPDDPGDEKVLACAAEAGADLIVSGDHHLLTLGDYRGIPVISVREFLKRLDSAAA